ncbi:YeeE/YedE family protein [Halarcobacter sp.]|uniref:YeeE/YedE family protein n=1 Tax=Halarcobacter TaxID=2321115 RepID=UPI003A932B57
MDLEIFQIVNILGFAIGAIFGMIAQKRQFCFSGSIKDYMLTKSTMRGASVVMAMIVAIVSTALISSHYELDFSDTPYYKENINYFVIILGGLMFGVGMMLADGCSNRHLIKFAQGDKNSLISIVFIGIFAFATARGFLSGYLNPITNNPTLIEWSAFIEEKTMNIYVVVGILLVILFALTKKIKRVFSLWDGVLVGLLVAAAWTVTGVLGEESIERLISFEGISFVYPTGKTIELFMLYQVNELTFSISLVLGVLIGAFTMSKFNRRYSFGCTAAKGENRVRNNMIGGALMGTGGVLSIGCTVGQGLTGLSTLAFGSAVAIVSIFVGGLVSAIYLNKRNELPMCFIFEWNDKDSKGSNLDYQI